jgi:hypothetical protein
MISICSWQEIPVLIVSCNTNYLPPWSRVNLKRAINSSASQYISHILRNMKFQYRLQSSPTSVFFWARWIHSTIFQTIYLRPVLILSSNLRLGLTLRIFRSRFLTKKTLVLCSNDFIRMFSYFTRNFWRENMYISDYENRKKNA